MSNVFIREITDNDYEDIARYHSSFPEEDRTYQQWLDRIKYWWDENPAYYKGHPRGVLAIENNRIIGMTSNIPTRMVLDGKEIIVINGSSWRVLPEYRKYSMDIWDKHRELTKDFILFNTTAIPQVVKLLKYLKFTEFQVADKWYYYFGDSESVQKGIKLKILGFGQKNYNRILNIINTTNNKGIKISISATDDEIDGLWNKTKDRYSFTNTRDSSYLKWVGKTKIIVYFYKFGILAGFVILHYSNQKNILTLVDYWGNEILDYFAQIVRYIIAQNQDTNIMIPIYSNRIEKCLKKKMLIMRKINKKAYFKVPKNIQINLDNSKMNLLQGDYGL